MSIGRTMPLPKPLSRRLLNPLSGRLQRASWLATLLSACGAAPESSTAARGAAVDSSAWGTGPHAGAGASFNGRPTSTTTTLAPTTVTLAGLDDGESCAAISVRAQRQRTPADIIIAVDNSGSMSEEIGFVRAELNRFSEQVVASGVDARIILISAPYAPQPLDDDDDADEGVGESDEEDDNGICIDAPLGSGSCPDDTRAPGYLHVNQAVKSHDALNLFIDTYPAWRHQLRAGASKTFVVVSDDNADRAPNNSAAAFMQSVANLPGGLFDRWQFSGIFCQRECAYAAEIGAVYRALVDATGGVAGELCDQNFAPVFDALAQAVIEASGLACVWDIPAPPPGQRFDRARVNVQYSTQAWAPATLLQVPNPNACADRGGWYYDNSLAPQQILVCPSTCAAFQNQWDAEVQVLFGCETQIAPL